MTYQNTTLWSKASADIFWGEIAPSDHVLQIYETDAIFLDTLAGFVGEGIKAGESVVVIATNEHLADLEERFRSVGMHIDHLLNENLYIPLDAEKTLSLFMVDGWPDEALFNKTVSAIISKAKKKGRKIRAFGEMVAILWAQGLNGATVQLEHLWNKFCEKESFCLFCAYPKSGMTNTLTESMEHICCSHSKIVNGSVSSMREVIYRKS